MQGAGCHFGRRGRQPAWTGVKLYRAIVKGCKTSQYWPFQTSSIFAWRSPILDAVFFSGSAVGCHKMRRISLAKQNGYPRGSFSATSWCKFRYIACFHSCGLPAHRLLVWVTLLHNVKWASTWGFGPTDLHAYHDFITAACVSRTICEPGRLQKHM